MALPASVLSWTGSLMTAPAATVGSVAHDEHSLTATVRAAHMWMQVGTEKRPQAGPRDE
jgi:hypothetical protein